MRILHVITSLRTGGAEHLMVDLLPRLRDLGNEVELLLFDGTRTAFYEQLEQKGIIVHSLGIGGNVYNPVNIFKLTKYIGKYDIIHTHNTSCQLFAPIAKLLSFSKAILLTTEHSSNNRRRGKWYLKFVDKWMYNRYISVICISDQPAVNLRNYIGNNDRIIVINNGVDVEKFLHPIKDVSNQNNFIITQVSSFNDAKDQDTLVKAIKVLPYNYKLQFVGDGVRRQKVQDLSIKLGVTDRVVFLGILSDIPNVIVALKGNIQRNNYPA